MKNVISSMLVPFLVLTALLIVLTMSLYYVFDKRNEHSDMRAIEAQKTEELRALQERINVEESKVNRFQTNKEFVQEIAHQEGMLFRHEMVVEFRE